MLEVFVKIMAVISFVLLIVMILGNLFIPNKVMLSRRRKDIISTESLIREFDYMFLVVKYQKTKEILECLLEMQELDDIYLNIKKRGGKIMGLTTYNNLKKETLKKIINEKINSISVSFNKLDKFNSLKDELIYCRKRFPEFKEVFDSKLTSVRHNIKMYSETL